MNRGKKLERIKQEIESLQQEQAQFRSERYIRELDHKSGGLYSNYMKKKDSISNLKERGSKPETSQAIMLSRKKSRSFMKEVRQDQNRVADTSIGDMLNGRNSPIMDNWIEEKVKTPPQNSKAQRIKTRIDSILEKERRCCCGFGKLFKSEL